MKPTHKSYSLEKAINAFIGVNRQDTINYNKCIPAPIGCGKQINPQTEFMDETSRKEFTISGLCQECQNKIFGV